MVETPNGVASSDLHLLDELGFEEGGIEENAEKDMTIGEEVGGPAAPKIARLMYFVGAAIVCTAAINKWRDLERKSLLKKQQQQNLPSQSPDAAAALHNVVD